MVASGSDTLESITQVDIADVVGNQQINHVVVYALGGDDVVWVTTWDTAHTVYGGEGDDELNGNQLTSFLYGQSGNDHLEGGGGSDLLSGGDDADTLIGCRIFFGVNVSDMAEDYLHGGDGPDTFQSEPAGDTPDIMLDYNNLEDSIE